MHFCKCEYCEQRRKREAQHEWSWPWFLTVAAITVALAVLGLCVGFLLGAPR